MKEVYANILRDHFGLDPIGRGDFDWSAVLRESYPTIHKHLLDFADSNNFAGANNPYRASGSPENTPEGHLANWQSFGPSIWTEMLQVHTDAKRVALRVPFRIGDWVYASPGNYAVRIPLRFAPDVPVNPEGPGVVESFFQPQAGPGHWRKFTDLGVLPAAEKRECDSCRGHGYNTLKVGNTHYPGEPCASCGGDGERKVYPRVRLEVVDPTLRLARARFMTSKVVAMLSLLPDAQWKASTDVQSCVGTFAGGQGQFVAVLYPEET